MPFKSKAQARMFYAKEANGEIPKGTSKEWSEDTNFKALPEHVKKASLNTAFYKVAEELFNPKAAAPPQLDQSSQGQQKSPSEHRRDLTLQKVEGRKGRPARPSRY